MPKLSCWTHRERCTVAVLNRSCIWTFHSSEALFPPISYTHHQQHQTLHLVEQCPQTKPILLSACGYEEAYNMRLVAQPLRKHASRTLFCSSPLTTFQRSSQHVPRNSRHQDCLWRLAEAEYQWEASLNWSDLLGWANHSCATC